MGEWSDLVAGPGHGQPARLTWRGRAALCHVTRVRGEAEVVHVTRVSGGHMTRVSAGHLSILDFLFFFLNTIFILSERKLMVLLKLKLDNQIAALLPV